jgi:hypothetical protein
VWLGVGSSSDDTPPTVINRSPPTPQAVAPPAPPPKPRVARASGVNLVLTGTGDVGSYVEVRGRNAQGPVVYQDTVTPGATHRWKVKRSLWMRVGNTLGLQARVNGRVAPLFGGTANFLVTKRGVRQLTAD